MNAKWVATRPTVVTGSPRGGSIFDFTRPKVLIYANGSAATAGFDAAPTHAADEEQGPTGQPK
jgi:hypothetical protein